MANQYTSGWTDQDIEFLENSIGVLSYDKIAKKLGKTPSAVDRKIDKLGIGNTKISSGMLTMHQLSKCLCIDDKKVKKLIVENGLPAKQKDFRISDKNKTKRLLYYIEVREFWKWAEENKDLINWYQVPQYSLPPEPDWLEARRREDYPKWLKRRKPWTEEQDAQLWNLYYKEGKLQKEIAIIMAKTQCSVEKRLKRLREQKLLVV